MIVKTAPLAVLFALVVLIGGEKVGAAASRVVLVRVSGADAVSRQATTLLTAELQAVGFEVVEVDGDPRHDLRRDIEAVSTRLQPVATFAILSVASGTTVELWLEDRVTGKLVIRRVAVSTGAGAAGDLAVKAVELLRGSLLEVTVQGGGGSGTGPDSEPAPGDVRRFMAEAAPDRLRYFSQGVGIAAGGSALRNVDLATAYAPLLRISWGSRSGFLVRLRASGLGSSPDLRAVEGTAEVRQSLLMAEVMRVFRAGARLQPYVGIAAGIHHVRSTGTGVSALFPDGAGTSTAVAAGVEAGLAVRLGNRLALVMDLGLLGSLPRTTIRIAGRDVAHTGGVALEAAVSVAAAF